MILVNEENLKVSKERGLHEFLEGRVQNFLIEMVHSFIITTTVLNHATVLRCTLQPTKRELHKQDKGRKKKTKTKITKRHTLCPRFKTPQPKNKKRNLECGLSTKRVDRNYPGTLASSINGSRKRNCGRSFRGHRHSNKDSHESHENPKPRRSRSLLLSLRFHHHSSQCRCFRNKAPRFLALVNGSQ